MEAEENARRQGETGTHKEAENHVEFERHILFHFTALQERKVIIDLYHYDEMGVISRQ